MYHGRLEDNTEVAVKMLSGTSSSGFNGFLAEVTTSEYKFQHNTCDCKLVSHTVALCIASDIYTFFLSHYIGSELDKGASQESSFIGWLLLGEGSFSIGLRIHV